MTRPEPASFVGGDGFVILLEARGAMVQIRLPDGTVKDYPQGVRPREIAEGIGKRLAEAAIAAVADGAIVDLDRPLEAAEGQEVAFRVLTPRDKDALDVLRHSTAHVMARAIMRVFPGVKLAFGPTTAAGFYYDIDIPNRRLTEDDFPAIEAEMAKITALAEPFERFTLPVPEARAFVEELGQGYKTEHIDEELHKFGTLSFYRQGEFVDLCRGPHIPHAGKVGAFKLLSLAGAYWKGRADGPTLQRVYGTAFFDKKELDVHLAQVEEAKKRDHRRIGKDLGLFTISQLVGSGLILWMPKGAIVRGVLEGYIKEELVKHGYQPVYTPHIGNIKLYETSGHYPYYKESQFPPIRLHSDAGTELLEMLETRSHDYPAVQNLMPSYDPNEEARLLKSTGLKPDGYFSLHSVADKLDFFKSFGGSQPDLFNLKSLLEGNEPEDIFGQLSSEELNRFSTAIDQMSSEGRQAFFEGIFLRKNNIDSSGYWERNNLGRIAFIKGMDVDEYLLKPMNCPHHIQIYAAQPRSYRDLPVRLAEFGTVYRYEKSGELSGLTRVRGFTQDDAHLFCTVDQVRGEFRSTMELTRSILSTLGLTDYRLRLSKHDPDDPKYKGAEGDVWRRAEGDIRAVLDEMQLPYDEAAGEAAFYGPKADFLVKDCIGRQWQLGTVQLDYVLPGRFGLTYTGKDNLPHQPVMIHRAPLGSMERFMGILIEHFAGAFPLWLAPEQVRVLPISDKVNDYAGTVLAALRAAGLRAEIDSRPEKIGAKIRDAQLEKIPVMLVVGAKEAEAKTVSYRDRVTGDLGATPLEAAVARIKADSDTRSIHQVAPHPAAAEPEDAGERHAY